MENIKETIARSLLSIKAVFFRPNEPFTWASGIKSPVYCDNRLILSAPKIRERDNYTCQMCGKHSNLHVHHKVHLSKIIQDIIAENEDKTHDELYDVIINDERFLDEDNLITLCKDCHLFGVHGYKKSISNEAQ